MEIQSKERKHNSLESWKKKLEDMNLKIRKGG